MLKDEPQLKWIDASREYFQEESYANRMVPTKEALANKMARNAASAKPTR
jgi:hypothetical protein